MSYSEKFELVRTSLISHCKKRISENWLRHFDMWLSCEADMEFGHGYQNEFKKEFGKYMNSEIEAQLWFAGKNLIFAICAFMLYKDDAELHDVIDFTDKFVSQQLDDFDNWCEDIGQAMYEETSEYEREFGNKKEVNNS
jgi:hypothetical protein